MNNVDKNKDAGEEAFIEQARSLLQQGEDRLDRTTLDRLEQARRHALEGRGSRSGSDWLLPAGGLVAATATVAIVVGLNLFSTGLTQNEVPEAFNDFDLLVSSDELEFYEQLDFYAWLDEQDKNG